MKAPKAPASTTKIVWEENSLDVDFGAQLRLLQRGELPKDFKKMNGVGSGVLS
jgi:hypothetical protein